MYYGAGSKCIHCEWGKRHRKGPLWLGKDIHKGLLEFTEQLSGTADEVHPWEISTLVLGCFRKI